MEKKEQVCKFSSEKKCDRCKCEYRKPALLEVGQSSDLVQGANGIGPYDMSSYYLQLAND